MYDESMYDVLIIGAGPVGQVLGNLLGAYGLTVHIIDREQAIYPLPRAVHYDSEVMRIFQSMDLADRILSQVRVNPGTLFKNRDGQLLVDWSRPSVTDQQWNASYRFHQPDLETILINALGRFENVSLKRGIEFLSFDQRYVHHKTGNPKTTTESSPFVTIHCRDTANEQRSTLKARYVVACDGANSSVRNALSIDSEDLGFAERWLVCDVALAQEDFHLGDHTIQFCDSERPATYVRTPGNRRRWEIRLKPREFLDHVPTEHEVWTLLSPWLQPTEGSLERSAIYTFKSLLAEKWRAERVFLAGDAAHLMPPFMGQGMCAGFRDASNLAWKLAWILAHETSTKISPQTEDCNSADKHEPTDNTIAHQSYLLDSYEKERKPHVREFIDASIQCGKLLNRSYSAAELDKTLLSSEGSNKMKTPRPVLGSSGTHPTRTRAHSAIDNENQSPQCSDSIPERTNNKHRGLLSAQLLIGQKHKEDKNASASPIRSDSFNPRGFILLCSGAFFKQIVNEIETQQINVRLHQCTNATLWGHKIQRLSPDTDTQEQNRGKAGSVKDEGQTTSVVVLTDNTDQSVTDYLADMDCNALLIRPDRYISGSASSAPEAVELLMNSPWQSIS